MRKLVRVQIVENGRKRNFEAVWDDEKMQYESPFPGQIVRAWEYGLFGKELPVPQAPMPEKKG